METTYLPGTIRDRLKDLMKSRDITQAELAIRIGSTEGFAAQNQLYASAMEKLKERRRRQRIWND